MSEETLPYFVNFRRPLLPLEEYIGCIDVISIIGRIRPIIKTTDFETYGNENSQQYY